MMHSKISDFLSLNPASIHFGLFLIVIFLLGYLLIYCTELKNKINKKRISTQFWMYLTVYLILICPIFMTAIALIFLIFLTMKELFNLNQQLGHQTQEPVGVLLLLFMSLAPITSFMGFKYLVIYIYFLFVLASFLILIFYQIKNMAQAIMLITISCLLCLSLNSLIFLRIQPKGMELCLFVLFLTNAFDSFAFFGGGLWGKNKLYYELSPGKTVEGSIIALVCTILFGFLFNYLLVLHFTWWFTIAISLVIALTSQLGDLIASISKRAANIKDFSTILPGHGGILDRCDSLILSLPAAIAVFTLFGSAILS